MLKSIVWGKNALHNLRNNERGVVSFEYIIVAACIVAIVITVFASDGTIADALNTGIGKIVANFNKLP